MLSRRLAGHPHVSATHAQIQRLNSLTHGKVLATFGMNGSSEYGSMQPPMVARHGRTYARTQRKVILLSSDLGRSTIFRVDHFIGTIYHPRRSLATDSQGGQNTD